MKFKIGNIEIKNKIVLAPMAGISNPAYIKICEEMNLGYAITELISAEAIVRDNKKTFDMLNGIDMLNIPVAIQIFGSNIETLTKAAKIITDLYKNVFIDINMGCPVPKVAVKNQAGSALLKNPEKIYEIVQSVKKAVTVPVTVKIRSGWDSNSINAVEVAKIVEKAGADAITIHPRTRAQGYTGKADWNIIKQVKQSVKIPVIGNGDVKNCYDAKRMMNETNCDAIMIGRGVLGNPWLIKACVDYLENNIEPKKISYNDKIDMIQKHFNLLLKTKNEKLALLEIRSHAAWYLKGIPNASQLKEKIFKINTKKEFNDLIKEFKENNYYESEI
ncbi:MAG: tRNA dihydrouridine synthase DusB [Bacilli bacterium]|nr:tRNA dihydrouridine synthase DusB [Bacilli bacterium]